MNKRATMIVGLGGGGCRVTESVLHQVRPGTSVVAIDTDTRSLTASRATAKVELGAASLAGLGAGGDTDAGRAAAAEDHDRLLSLFAGNDLVCLVAALGGGTATGAAPVVLEAAREQGALTLCFATLPFAFEGVRRRLVAGKALADLTAACDAVVVAPNDRLFELSDQDQVAEAFRQADDLLASGVCAIAHLVTHPGYINLGFADIRKMVRGTGGTCSFAFSEACGEDRVETVLGRLLESPLLEYGRLLSSARAALVSIAGGSDLTLKEVGQIMDRVGARLSDDCRMTMGTVLAEDAEAWLGVAVLVAEQWIEKPPKPAEPAARKQTPERPATTRPRRKPGRQQAFQTSLRLDVPGKGRFKDVEPTILDGKDLDIPTFMRRHIEIER